MDISALKKKALSVWIPFIGDTRLHVRHVTRDELKTLADQATTKALVSSEMQEKFDNSKFNDLLCQKAVIDLEGFEDDGQPFLCTPDNVQFLAQQSGQFVTLVRNTCTDLEKLFSLWKEEQKKNSESTLPDASITQA